MEYIADFQVNIRALHTMLLFMLCCQTSVLWCGETSHGAKRDLYVLGFFHYLLGKYLMICEI